MTIAKQAPSTRFNPTTNHNFSERHRQMSQSSPASSSPSELQVLGDANASSCSMSCSMSSTATAILCSSDSTESTATTTSSHHPMEDGSTTAPSHESNNDSASSTSNPTSSLLQEQQDDVIEGLVIMKKQEGTVYNRVSSNRSDDNGSGRIEFPDSSAIDGAWRQKIIEWMYSVVDNCNLRRDSVAVAAYYLDMCFLLSTTPNQTTARASSSSSSSYLFNNNNNIIIINSQREYQLCAMTSLQLAVKLYETSTLFTLDSLVKLSRGLFQTEDLKTMEMNMLSAMKWYVHPPTTGCFIRQYLRFLFLLPLPQEVVVTNTNQNNMGQQEPQQQALIVMPAFTRYLIIEITRFLSETSVCLSKFVKYPSSVIALACLLVALEGLTSTDIENHSGGNDHHNRSNNNTLLPGLQHQYIINHLIDNDVFNYSSNEVFEAFGDLQQYLHHNMNMEELIHTITMSSGQ